MKTIGLIGGLSWESSIEYYRIINESVREKLSGLHSAKSLMYSFDFEEVEKLQHQGEWDKATQLMVDAAQRVEKGGADFIIICSNTMHKMAEEVQKSIGIPLLHITDATAERIKIQGFRRIGLIATKFTMEQDFYKGRLEQNYNFEVVIPNQEERQIIHDVIYNELCLGEIKQSSKDEYKRIIGNLITKGAEAIILGCTEITLLIQQEDSEIPLFDSTAIHAASAVQYAIE